MGNGAVVSAGSADVAEQIRWEPWKPKMISDRRLRNNRPIWPLMDCGERLSVESMAEFLPEGDAKLAQRFNAGKRPITNLEGKPTITIVEVP